MAGFQKFSLTGTLGKDVKMLPMENSILGVIHVFCREQWANKAGEKGERTQVFVCNVWGKKATSLEHLLKKGSLVQIEGKLIRREIAGDDSDLIKDVVVDVETILVHRVKENGLYIERD
jgi:single-stranded DNA-binding protein